MTIKLNELIKNNGSNFAKEIEEKAGVVFNMCFHCQSCSGGCPFSEEMDYLPNKIIRLVQLGQKKEVLESSAIWVCVGCNTCCIQCPNAIDMPSLMDTLRCMAVEENYSIAEPDIHNFHKEVLNSINRYGRTHKLEIMFKYKLKKMDLFSDIGIGTKMLAKRKLEFLPSKVKNISEIRGLFTDK